MNNRRRGDAFERLIRARLDACGWVVVRAGGSLGAFDLCALKSSRKPVFIQAKIDGRLDHEPWNTLYLVAEQAGAIPVLAWRPGRGEIAYGVLKSPRDRFARLDQLLLDWRP